VVIGETAILGRDLHIHQGVSIAGIDRRDVGRRHAHICDRAIIHPGVVLLWPI